MSGYPTPHIDARPGDFAPTVLMPGDPKRSRFIAENFLCAAKPVNDVRGVQGYTGEYRGRRVSVMASGMGMPSIGIYSWELFNIFGVENIIRVGSAGGLRPEVGLRELVLAAGACTNSNFALQYSLPGCFAPIADPVLLRTAQDACARLGLRAHTGNVLSSDTFYSDDTGASEKWAALGVLAVEMETAALYMNAARSGKRALAVLTVSDRIFTGESTTSDERQNSFTEMMRLALETAADMEEMK